MSKEFLLKTRNNLQILKDISLKRSMYWNASAFEAAQLAISDMVKILDMENEIENQYSDCADCGATIPSYDSDETCNACYEKRRRKYQALK